MNIRRIGAVVATAAAAAMFGAAVGRAGAQQAVRDLRLVDGGGAALEQVDAGPGEKRYHKDTGSEKLYIAFDCTGEKASAVQIRLLQPLGAPILQEDRQCAEAGTQIVEYDPAGNPLADNEYVVNLYVGDTELFLADSLQFTVGAATIPEGPLDEGRLDATPLPAAVDGGEAALPPSYSGSSNPASGSGVPGGPSRWMLVVAVAAIIGLMGLVLWAGRSAMRA